MGIAHTGQIDTARYQFGWTYEYYPYSKMSSLFNFGHYKE